MASGAWSAQEWSKTGKFEGDKRRRDGKRKLIVHSAIRLVRTRASNPSRWIPEYQAGVYESGGTRAVVFQSAQPEGGVSGR